MKVSYFKELKSSKGIIKPLEDVINEIRSCKHQSSLDEINQIINRRDLDLEQKKVRIRSTKRELPAFKPCLETTNKKGLNETDKPTGLVQADIDVSKNPDVDMDDLVSVLAQLPFTVYVFRSPSGGVKWAGKTNFVRHEGELIEVTKQRFAIAYERVVDVLADHIKVNMDHTVKAIATVCFMSADPNVYYNPNAETLVLGEIELPPKPKSDIKLPMATDVDESHIKTILSYIPKDLEHRDRMKVAWILLHNVGDGGEAMFVDHFHRNYAKLTREWENAKKYTNHYGHLGELVRMAKENGYKPKTGHGRRLEKAKPTSHRFPAPMKPEEATTTLQNILSECFVKKKSHYVSMSCGLGKTETMLDFVVKHADDMNIMICAPTVALQRQIYNRLEQKYKASVGEFLALQSMQKVQMTRGRLASDDDGPMCVQSKMVVGLQKIHAGLPVDECYKCPSFNGCRYIHQFQDFHRVRIVTTSQYFNGPGIWDGSHKAGRNGILPADRHYVPDLIIIDENAVQIETVEVTHRSPFASLKLVLAHCTTGKNLMEAVKAVEQDILTEYDIAKNMKKKLAGKIRRNPNANISTYNAEHFTVLQAFYRFLITGYDEAALDGIRFRKEVRAEHYSSESCIEYVSVKTPDAKYEGVPTVFLDATANEDVVKRVFPTVPFTKLVVEQTPEVEIHQLQGASVSKTWLKNGSNEDKVVSRIKAAIEKDQINDPRVGLITYKSLGADKEYHKTLGEKISATKVAYFGNVRGQNDFEDVDYLFIVGRNAANGVDHERFGLAVFGHEWEGAMEYMDQLVAMQDGSSMTLNARRYTHGVDFNIYRHCSVHETIQAVGRARPIHGTKKKVFLFSNESLGEDVRMTGFFELEAQPFAEQIDLIASKNHIDWSSKQERKACNITNYMRSNKEDEFFEQAWANGLEVVIVEGKDTHRNPVKKTFITANTELLVETLEAANTNVESVQSYSKASNG